MKKNNEIIKNLRDYSAAQVAQAIKAGEVTLYELSKSGNLTPLMRKRIEEQLEKSEEQVDPAPSVPEAQPVTNPYPQHTEPEPPQEYEERTPPAREPDTENGGYNGGKEVEIDNRGMFKRPFSFEGRIRRTEYGLSYIFFCILQLFFSSITEAFTINPSDSAVMFLPILYIILAPLLCWFMWAQSAKRCHDRGNSGWYQFIPFYFLVLLFGDGERGTNQYGTNPKQD